MIVQLLTLECLCPNRLFNPSISGINTVFFRIKVTVQLDTGRADLMSPATVYKFSLPAPPPSLREAALRAPKNLARVHEVDDEEGNEHRQCIQT